MLEALKIAASKDPKSFNNSIIDKICEERRYYQYHKLLSIMMDRSEFSYPYHTKANSIKISYLKGFQLTSEFWHLRNITLAKNILHIVNKNSLKKTIVLTGFMHKYYFISELQKQTKNDASIIVKEFYDEQKIIAFQRNLLV